MGWTYRLESKSGVTLIDDDIFDREYLGRFLGLSKEESAAIDNDGECTIGTDHLKRAISFLTDFNERIKKMPWDTGAENAGGKINELGQDGNLIFDKDGLLLYRYIGSDNNIAIYKEVEAVLSKASHFIFPWDGNAWTEDCGFGITYMIDALTDALDTMQQMGIDTAVLLCY